MIRHTSELKCQNTGRAAPRAAMHARDSRAQRRVIIMRGLSTVLACGLAACASSHTTLGTNPAASMEPEKIYRTTRNEGSIWPGDSPNNLFFKDAKARAIGDIVTILVAETTTSTQSATTGTTRKSSASFAAGRLLGLPSDLGIQNFLGLGSAFNPRADSANNTSHDGQGTTTRNGRLTATITATIKEILPNGNFQIEGKRSVTINNEEQIMILSGVVRSADINFDNTISSSLIADAAITYTGSGVINDVQQVGWGSRILSWIWPF